MTDNKPRTEAKPISLSEAYDIAYGAHKFRVNKVRIAEVVTRGADWAATVEADLKG